MLQVLLRTAVLALIISICNGFTSNARLLKKSSASAPNLVIFPRLTAKSLSLGRQKLQSKIYHKQGKHVTSALRMSVSETSDAVVHFLVEHPLQDFIALVFFKFAYDALRDGASLPVAFVAGVYACNFLFSRLFNSLDTRSSTAPSYGTQRNRVSRQAR
jgi:hypothetical protein